MTRMLGTTAPCAGERRTWSRLPGRGPAYTPRGSSRRALSILVIAAVAAAVLLDSGAARAASRNDLVAEVGSYDIAAGLPARFTTGVFTADHRYVGWGTVRMRFFYLGPRGATRRRVPRVAALATTARFLAVPGVATKPEPVAPTIGSASKERGVYSADVGFDRAGFWEVRVSARIHGGRARSTTAAFEVLDHHQVPAPGDPALPTENFTLSSPGVARSSIDSRATGGSVPDPELHQSTIAASLRAHRPVVVVFSTPAFCTSSMCGPITDMVQGLAHAYADRADFVHIEIWKSFKTHEVNDAASEWLAAHGNDLREPWVFLIGADGRITARWDNVVTREEIEPLLRALPKL